MGHVHLAEFLAPVGPLAEELVVSRLAAGVGQPLNVIGEENVFGRGIVDARVDGGGGNDGGEVRRPLASRGPLIVTGVGAAPHRHLAVGPRLAGQPLDDVVTVPRLLSKGIESAARAAAPPHVHESVDIAMPGEVHRPRVVAVADVGREREHHRQRLFLSGRPVQRRSQLDAVPHGNAKAPLEVDVLIVRSGKSGGEGE